MPEDKIGGYWFPTSDASGKNHLDNPRPNQRMTPVWVEATRTLFETRMPWCTRVASILQSQELEMSRIRLLTETLIKLERCHNELVEKMSNQYGTVKFEPILDLDKCDEINSLLKSIEEGTDVNS
jgi:hypothetical protein